ncbi:MAG TPA: hypothetical protein VNB68_04985, partial [Nitrososphaeraceae archaeon]|nr:hypothetical protein [Nitrososphaeraceae archaeon]
LSELLKKIVLPSNQLKCRNYSVCVSLSVCVRVCDEPEIIVDHNHKGKKLFTLHLRKFRY